MALRLGSKRVCAALRVPKPFTIAPVSIQRYASSAATAASSLPNGVKESIEVRLCPETHCWPIDIC